MENAGFCEKMKDFTIIIDTHDTKDIHKLTSFRNYQKWIFPT
jgi:hypothetical protein